LHEQGTFATLHSESGDQSKLKQELSSSWDGWPCHNRHGPKRGGAVPLSQSAGNPPNSIQLSA